MQRAVGIRVGALCLLLSVAGAAAAAPPGPPKPKKDEDIELTLLGSFSSGETAPSGSEIAAYDTLAGLWA